MVTYENVDGTNGLPRGKQDVGELWDIVPQYRQHKKYWADIFKGLGNTFKGTRST
jgi:hypothetical protein